MYDIIKGMNINRRTNLITWSKTFMCGIKIIDDQHKSLVDMVNEMFSHVPKNEKEEKDYLESILQEAVKYIKIHFATEERILTATKFKGYAEHKKAHDQFIIKVTENVMELKSGKRLTLLSYTKFLKEWVLSHIAVMDKQYFEYFKMIATRKTDGKLSITSDDVKNLDTQ